MTEDGKEMGKEETIFEEPESADMGWLNEYGEITPPASVWISTSEEEIDHDPKLSQGTRKSSSTSSYRKSEEQKVEDMRRSKDSGMSDESLRSAQVRIAAQQMVEELRIADEILARVRDGRGYQDCNVL
jgi:hypothetical protein